MGLLDGIFGSRARQRAERAEREGRLGDAVEAWLQAGLGDEAARVLLARADGAAEVEARLAFCEAAAKNAATDEVRQKALGRRAAVRFDLLESAAAPRAEWALVAGELERAGLFERAAQAWSRAGDADGEVRALTQAGAIEALEARLEADGQRESAVRDLTAALARFEDRDRALARREALADAQRELDRAPRSKDREERAGRERLELAARAVRERLVGPPFLRIRWNGEEIRVVLGAEVVLGRSEGTLLLRSASLSRKHLRVFRGAGGDPAVEDLGSRNGTRLGGARLAGQVLVGAGLDLVVGDDLPLRIAPFRGGVSLTIGGVTLLAPLGPLALRPTGEDATREPLTVDADGNWIRLTAPPGARPFAGELEVGPSAELCRGDVLSLPRGGPPALEVLGDEGPLEA